MISSYKSLLLVALTSSFVLGCKPKNPDLYGAAPEVVPPVAKDVKYTGKTFFPAERPEQPPIPPGKELEPLEEPQAIAAERYMQRDSEIFKPKIDILVVMDPSDSMKDEQRNLRSNMRIFSEKFSNKKDFLDLHLASVSAWDSISFEGQDKNCELGQLRPIGGNGGRFKGNCSAAQNEIPYITNETSLKEWGPTLAFGVESFKRDADGSVNINSGPQHEELFSPVIAALRPESQKMNKNFRRSDAHLAVIFFTDTDDLDYINLERDAEKQDDNTKATLLREAAKLSRQKRESLEVLPSEIANFLKSQEKENVSVSAYGVLGRYDQWISTKGNTTGKYENADFYIQQPGRGPRKVVELLALVNGIEVEKLADTKGIVFDLSDSQFGQELSKIGNDIVAKSMRRTIILDFPPNIANLKRYPIVVKYGANQVIAEKTGWTYSANETDASGRLIHKIIINEGAQLQLEAGARFSVEYTPVR